jgi:lipid-binding SYLF domain-containing protein
MFKLVHLWEVLIMKTRLGIATVLLTLVSSVSNAQQVRDVSETLEMFRGIPEVAPYFDSAYGYAVWRRIARGGLGIGAATGRGQVYVNGQFMGFSRLVDVTIGIQAGGQAYRQIIFFQNKAAYDEFTGGNFEFDASASAVAVTASAQASAGTQGAQATAGAGNPGRAAGGGYQNGLQVFTMAEGGLMYQATIGGQKYNFRAAQ